LPYPKTIVVYFVEIATQKKKKSKKIKKKKMFNGFAYLLKVRV